jgi:hypothetical protein
VGLRVSTAIPQADALRLWLAMLAGSEPEGGLLELRGKRPGQPLRRLAFRSVADQRAIAGAIQASARIGDIYVGLAPRREVYRLRDGKRSGGIDAIQHVWTLWVDADTPAACAALRAFEPAAAVLVNSGNGLHGYWPLSSPLGPQHAKRANRRLAHRLQADMNATDAARIMRPPATFNFKSDPPRPVVCERLETLSYASREVVGQLPDPPSRSPAQAPTTGRSSNPSSLLRGTADVVRAATPGNRNAALNWAAYALGKRVATGELDEQSVRDELHDAAAAAGLPEHEIVGTLASGLCAGRVAA